VNATQQSLFPIAAAAKPVAKEAPPPPRRNLVIEAGAGTGKTTAIVAEVLQLLLGDEELAPERIVLVTFTEKAAGEIADRIHHALTEIELAFDGGAAIAWPLGSDNPLFTIAAERLAAARRACARQLARIDALRSQTIHSFCQSLLRQFPIEAGLDPQFRIIEGFERSLLYAELYDDWIDHETRIAPEATALRQWETLVEHIGYLFLIRELLFSLVDRRDLLLDPRYDAGSVREVETDLVRALNVTHAFNAPPAIAEYVARHAPPTGADLDTWIDYLAPIAGEIRTADLPRKKDLQLLNAALKELRAGQRGEAIVDRLVAHRAAQALHALATRFIHFLDERKRALGVVDFDDLLLRTHAVLGDEAVLERVRGQFDYLFVDEFQDTDRVQAQIIDRLARDAGGALVPGRTVVVGDPKQSIYGFRRANPETYHRMTEGLIAAGAEHRKITGQYRSEPVLLEAINSMFGRLFPPQLAHDPNVFRPPYHPLTAGKPASAEPAEPLTFLDSGAADREAWHTAEGDTIAAWIERTRDRDGSDLRRFAILLRRTTYLDDYLDALDRAGIAYVLPPTRMFLDRRAPVDLLAVLRAVAYPFDRGAEISAARTPYFALTDQEIATGIVGEESSPAWQSFLEVLGSLRAASAHLTVAQLIDHVVAATNINAVYFAAADGDRASRHIAHVRSLAFGYDQKSGGSVRQFVDEIARRRSDPDEMEPSLVDEAQNAVRILTVHAAKGLEFETVILPDLEFPSPAPDAFTVEEPPSLVLRGQVETLTARFRKAAGEPLKEIAKQREEEEMRRLFYVAVTRAMRDVVFVMSPAVSKKMGFFKCVTELFGDDCARPLAAMTSSTPAAALPPRRRLADAERETALAAADVVPLSLAAPPPAAPLLDAAAVRGERARAAGRAAGILLHRLLERWDGRAPAAPLLDQLAAEIGADRNTTMRVRQQLAAIPRSPTFQSLAAAESLGREVPITITLPDGSLAERRIDHWLREADADLVVDYKSGQPCDEDRQQVAQYCRAIETLTGRACRGLVWYVDGDVAVDVESAE
jgi:ATP-dependent helicase/nuclease subunit A